MLGRVLCSWRRDLVERAESGLIEVMVDQDQRAWDHDSSDDETEEGEVDFCGIEVVVGLVDPWEGDDEGVHEAEDEAVV